jgi:hypothetical protein
VDIKRLAEWLVTADGSIKTITALFISAGTFAAAVTGQLKRIF